MKKPRENDSNEPSAPFWMVTYGDMVTLLLTFFILLISFANLDEVKFEQAAHSLKGALGILEKNTSQLKSNAIDVSEEDLLHRADIYESVMEVNRIASKLGFEDDISIEPGETGLLIQMGDRVLFDPGKADLKPEAFPILDIVGKTIREKAKEVLVAGHTDNVPIKTIQFPSNWELSTSRALSVVRYLIDETEVPPRFLAATGYSEFRPLKPNDSPESRQKNRRVELLVTWN